jgi:hypothetical protein
MQIIYSPNRCTMPQCNCVKSGWLVICQNNNEYQFGFSFEGQVWSKSNVYFADLDYHITNMNAFGYCCFLRNGKIIIHSEGHDFIALEPIN